MKSLHAAMLDPDLFGRTFGGPTFEHWRVVAKVLDGLPLEASELEFYLGNNGASGAAKKADSRGVPDEASPGGWNPLRCRRRAARRRAGLS